MDRNNKVVYALKKIADGESLDFFRQKSEPVTRNSENIKELLEAMASIMYDNNAIGIAAPMVGVPLRAIVVDLQEKGRRNPLVMLNPLIGHSSEETQEFPESSISLDGVVYNVKRPSTIRLSYEDENFTKQELEASGLLATCIQHEIDYLDGKLFFDYATEEDRELIIRGILNDLRVKNIAENMDILRTKCRKIENITEDILKTMDKMLDLMYLRHGIGLAANQVGLDVRMVVIDLQENGVKSPLFLINPEINKFSEEKSKFEEGCLSIPGCSAVVERPAGVEVVYQDREGKWQTLKADGLLATCLQHEIDHLNGKLYIDYVSKLKRDAIVKKVEKEIRKRK